MEDMFHEMDLLSRQLNQAHRAAVQWELNAAGLSEVGHPMLVSILQSAGEGPDRQCQAQRELADLLHISPAAVANSLKCLERDGYVRREPWEGDARRNRVLLTEKGVQAVEGCRAVFQRVSDQMMADFSPEERNQLAQFQRRMLDNLQSVYPRSEPRRERRERPDWQDRPESWGPRPGGSGDRRERPDWRGRPGAWGPRSGSPEDRGEQPPFIPNQKE